MASSPNSCGVDNSYVFPSDPNNAGTISATAGIGAINVSWTYPTVNPHAVAFVVVRRSTSANANSHTPIATTKGNSFSDPMSESQAGTRYYYWIQVFSVNGTAADYVGPANAVAGSHSQSILDLISGQINASDLAASLRQEIESIPSLRDSLIDEETGRLQAILDVEATLAALGLDITQTFAAVTSLETTSIDGADVMAQQISAVAASNGQNLAAITEETLARVGADSAEASKREALAVKVGQDISGAITAEATITANNLGVVAEQVNTVQAYTERAVFRQTSAPTEAQGRRTNSLWFDTDDGNKLYQWTGSAWVSLQDKVAIDAFAAIQRIDTTISQFDYASAQSVEDLESSVEYVQDVSIPNLGSSIGDVSGNVSDLVGDVVHLRDTTMPTVISANIQDYNATAVGFCILNNGFGATSTSTAHNTKAKCEAAGGAWQPLSAISKAVKQLEINDGGSTLTIQDKMEAYKDEFDNLKGEYTMKFSGTAAEGIIGGFGLAVGGPEGSRSVDAAFDVDRFWIGEPGAIQKPFVVQGGTVYIGNAMINDAAISTARIADLAVDTLKIANAAVTKPILYEITNAAFYYRSGNYWSQDPEFSFTMPRDPSAAGWNSIQTKLELCFAYAFQKDGSGITNGYSDIQYEWRVKHLPNPRDPISTSNSYGSWSGWYTGSSSLIAIGRIPIITPENVSGEAVGNFSGFGLFSGRSQSQYQFRLAPLDLDTHWSQAIFSSIRAQITSFLR